MTNHTDNKIRKYVKGYELMRFAKNLGSKYGKKVMNKGISAFLNLIKVNMVKF